MPNNRSQSFDFVTLSQMFNQLHGYFDLPNESLAISLLKWSFHEEENRKDINLVSNFMKWSFTVSFLELINAWQWFLAGVLLRRQAYMIAQMMQLYYYSIFFSYGSFLSGHGKGHYTIRAELDESHEIKATRSEIWFENEKPPYICIKDKGRGGEHESRANWFYEVFRKWDLRESHPAVILFENDRRFHTNDRNMFTYSLAEMATELSHSPQDSEGFATNEILLKLWHRDDELIDYFPEEFWVFEHLKVPLDLHIKLLENYDTVTPFTGAQILIVEGLLSHHEKTGMDLIREALDPILVHMKI